MKNPATSGGWNEFTQALYDRLMEERKAVMVRLRNNTYVPVVWVFQVDDNEEMCSRFEYRFENTWLTWTVDGRCDQSHSMDMMEFF